MNKYTRLLGDSIVFGIGNFITKLIYFFLMPIYTTTLSAKDFGISDLLTNSLSLVTPILTLSIADGIFRFVLDKDSSPTKLLNCGFYILIRSSLFVIIASTILYIIFRDFYWILFGVLYITEATRLLLANFARGLGKSVIFALNGIIGAAILIGSSYIFLKIIKLGVNGYLLAFIISNFSSCIFLYIASRIYLYFSFEKPDKLLFHELLHYCIPLIPNMLSWWFTNISSRYIIAGFCGMTLAGLFSAASKLPALINVLGSIFQQAWQYASVKEYQESSESNFYSIVFKIYSSFIIIVSSLVIIYIPYISRLVLKDEFYEAWIYTPALLFSAMLGCYSLFLGTFYAVVKDNKKAMYTTLAGSIVSLIVCFALIPIIGVLGALIANILGFSVIVYLRFLHVTKIIHLNIDYTKLISSILLTLAISVITTIHIQYYILFNWIILGIIIIIQRKDISILITRISYFIKNRNAFH